MKYIHDGEIKVALSEEEAQKLEKMLKSKENFDKLTKHLIQQMSEMRGAMVDEETKFWEGLMKKYDVDPRCRAHVDINTYEMIIVGIPPSADITLERWEPKTEH